MGITAAIAATVVAAGSTVAQAQQSQKAQKAASDANDVQISNQNTLNAQAQQRQQQQESQDAAVQARDNAKRAQSSGNGAAAGGAQSTILTSPLGVQSGAATPAGQKTLLGQ